MNKRIVASALVSLWLMSACSERRDWELAFNLKPPPGQDARFSTRGSVPEGTTEVPAGWGGQGTVDTPRTMFENHEAIPLRSPEHDIVLVTGEEHDVMPVRGEESEPAALDDTPQ
jgi:hypothetical protein